MNKNLLNTLLRLFAIIVQSDGLTEQNKLLVKNFLSQQFNESTAAEFLKVFISFVNQDAQRDEHQSIIALCSSVNNELTYEQKLFILIRVIELAFADNKVSMLEVKNIVLAAKHLNIEYREYQNIYSFITTNSPIHLDPSSILKNISLDENTAGQLLTEDDNPGDYLSVLHVVSANMFIMRYIGSSDIYLNGQLVKPTFVYILKKGSVVRANRIDPVYYSDVVDHFLHSTRGENLVFEARNVSYRFPTGAWGLNNVNIVEESGKMVAIMGGSGAGKSTLLSVINGTNRPTQGSVTINGVSIHDKPAELEGVIGFVAQEDMLIEELTVYQNLYFNAELCFSYKTPEELDTLVVQTLTELGLIETRDLRVGDPLKDNNISGGQRKRLNIALELIREPSILFVDEPTSGLSSRDSENVMDLLKELAHKGKLVFVVIHQPSSDIFKLFDRLVLMDKGGYPVYYGNPIEGVRYFRRENDYVNSEQVECGECGNITPEQIFTILEARVIDEFGNTTKERKIAPRQWHDLMMEKQFKLPKPKQAYDAVENIINIPSGLRQFQVFVKRDVLAKLANRSFMTISLLIAPVLALVISFLLKSMPLDNYDAGDYYLQYNDDLPVYIFVSILIALFIGMIISSEQILQDRKIRKREQFLNLSKRSYLLSKICVLLGVTLFQMLVYTLIGNSIIEIKGLTLEYWFMLFTVAGFAVLLGLNISATFDSAVSIYLLIPILLIPQIVLSGAMVNFYKLNPVVGNIKVTPAVSDFFAARWAYEGLAVRQYKSNEFKRRFFTLDQAMSNARFKTDYLLPELENRLEFASQNYRNPDKKEQVEKNLRIVRRNIEDEFKAFNNVKPEYVNYVERLNMKRFNAQVARDVEKVIGKIRASRLRVIDNARKLKEEAIKRNRKNGVNLDSLERLHTNNYLNYIVTNAMISRSLIEYEGELVRITEPIYQKPDPDRFPLNYREHFYSPSKLFMGISFDTYWFNAWVIWAMTLLLYVTLYYETFRWLIRKSGVLVRRLRRNIHNRRVARQRLAALKKR